MMARQDARPTRRWIKLDKYDAIACRKHSKKIAGVIGHNIITCYLLIVESAEFVIAAHLTSRYNPQAILNAIQKWHKNGFGKITNVRILINGSPENLANLKRLGSFNHMMVALQHLKNQLMKSTLFKHAPRDQVIAIIESPFICFNTDTLKTGSLTKSISNTDWVNSPKTPISRIHYLTHCILCEQKEGDHHQTDLTIFTLKQLQGIAHLDTLPDYLSPFIDLVRENKRDQFDKIATDDPILKYVLQTIKPSSGITYIDTQSLWTLISGMMPKVVEETWRSWTKAGEEESITPEP